MSNGNDVGVERKQQQDPFAQKQPEACKPEPQGRLGDTWPITIPEQVVGSTHDFEFPAPRNLSSLGAVGMMTIDGASDLKADWGAPIAVPGMGSGPLKLTYAPTTVGEKHATLTLVMKWEDGHVEKRAIQVNARARKLDDVPDAEKAAPKKSPAAAPTGPAPADRPMMVGEGQSWMDAHDSFDGLMREQALGVRLVADESTKFKPKPADRSIWQDLAEIAFQLGTGAVAGLVARFVASRVSSAIVGAEHVASAARQGEAQIASAERSAAAAKGSPVEESAANDAVVAAKVGNYANADAAKHAKFAQAEVGTATGMAVSTAITKTANEIRGPQGGGGAPATTTEPQAAVATSPDAELAFFSDQSSMIGALNTAGAKQLNAVIADVLKRHPDIATDIVDGVTAGLAEATKGAKERQAANTSAQFMTYLARTNLGTEQVSTPDGARTVTDMSEQRSRGSSRLEPSGLAAGVLEIVCDYHRGGDVRVTDARAHNVSWMVAKRLLDKRLASSGVPMRLSLYGGGTIITRDEAGRVRVSGTLDMTPPYREEQQIREAERILNVVMSKSLADWGIPQIHTNDVTQCPDPTHESKKA